MSVFENSQSGIRTLDRRAQRQTHRRQSPGNPPRRDGGKEKVLLMQGIIYRVLFAQVAEC